jgi:hypothetical protein
MYQPRRAIAVLSLVVCVAAWSVPVAAEEPRVERSVEEMIRRLASEDFDTREAAAAALGKRPDAFLPLHHALRSDDRDLVKRAQAVIEQLRPVFRKRALKRLKETLDRGEVDLFVDRFVHLREDVSKEDWKVLLDFAERVRNRACDGTGVNTRYLEWPFLDHKPHHGDLAVQGGVVADRKIAADKVALDDSTFTRSLLVCRGSVQGNNWTTENVIFANGNVTTRGKHPAGSISLCLVVCEGDIESRDVPGSVLIASGAVKTHFKPHNCVVIQKDPNPLKLIRRFDLSAVGAEVKDAQSGVEVLAVAEKKPFGVAGLRKGDRIVEVEGEQTPTSEDFRRQVRRRCLDDQVTRVTVRRGDQVVELLVHLVY